MRSFRFFLIVILLPLFAFSGGENHCASATPAAPGDTAVFTTDSVLALWLRSEAVYHDHYARKKLYTWTSPKQIDALRGGQHLLYKAFSDSGDHSLYDLALDDNKLNRDPVAIVLRGSDYRYKRFAWSNPWGTCLGYKEEHYGDQLIEMVLHDSALICKFVPDEKHPFSFCDVNGKTVSNDFALKHPERIAAVYHVSNEWSIGQRFAGKKLCSSMSRQKKYRFRETYREYVVVNEKMIARWQIATPDVMGVLVDDLLNLKMLYTQAKQSEKNGVIDDLPILDRKGRDWNTSPSGNDMRKLYNACLPFSADERYSGSSRNLAGIVDTLQSDWHRQGAALIRFPAKQN